MYSEIGFIFNPLLGSYGKSNNEGNIYQRPIRLAPSSPNKNTSQGQPTQGNSGNGSQNSNPNDPNKGPNAENGVLVYKNPNEFTGTVGIRNYLKLNVYKYDDTDEDPYISLLEYFGDKKTKSLILRAADFVYLKDLGVYPINRLWILRRFPDNCIVPNNLIDWGKKAVEPVSTVVGWMKDKEDTPLITLSFNEMWTDQNEMIDKILDQILKDNFTFKSPRSVSVPGWGQGLLFGMLNAMGLTNDYNAMNVPTGDPNVLRVAKMREINSQGLQSKMSLSLETTYEQKYINGVDPGLAMMDVLSNLFKMGTSDQRFILSNSPALQQLIGNINGNKNVNAWLDFIKNLLKSFLNGVADFIAAMASDSDDVITSATTNSEDVISDSTSGSTSGSTSSSTSSSTSGGAQDKNSVGSTGGLISNVANSLLAGTIAKYRWPLKGSIALMSGINTTPWHLTIGNPYSPIINIGNIHVNNVEIKLSNDLGFNDMPSRIDVTIGTEFGRPLGKQELEKMFNNGYKRVYSKKSPGSVTETQPVSSDVTASGQPASVNVLENKNQPDNTTSKINASDPAPYSYLPRESFPAMQFYT